MKNLLWPAQAVGPHGLGHGRVLRMLLGIYT